MGRERALRGSQRRIEDQGPPPLLLRAHVVAARACFLSAGVREIAAARARAVARTRQRLVVDHLLYGAPNSRRRAVGIASH